MGVRSNNHSVCFSSFTYGYGNDSDRGTSVIFCAVRKLALVKGNIVPGNKMVNYFNDDIGRLSDGYFSFFPSVLPAIATFHATTGLISI